MFKHLAGDCMNSLRILIRNYADFENALTEEARLFEADHPGTKIELISVGIHELYNSAITKAGLRDGRFDLALLVTDWLAEAHAAGALENLHPWQQHIPIRDWPGGWPRSLVQPLLFGNHLSSIPWHDGPECLVYRTDLFHDAAACNAFRSQFHRDLAPPATWEEFEQTARFFTDPNTNRYGTVFASFPDGHNTLYDFALQVWSRGGELIDSAGRPSLTTPIALAALGFYRRVVSDPALCHPKSPQLDSTQSGDLFLAGEVAMMANWFGFAARASREESPLAGKVAIAPIPTANGAPPVSLSVFWALAMGRGSRHKELAWQFLRYVASPERDLGITRHGTVGVRLSTWRDPELQARIPVYREVEAISLGARQLPSGPAMASFATIIDDVITGALTTSEPSAAILESAQLKIDTKGIRFV
jgi:multiple sugar transport system substrate-binding protein